MTDEEYIKIHKDLPPNFLDKDVIFEEIKRGISMKIHPEASQFFRDHEAFYKKLSACEEGYVEGFLAGLRYMENR